MRTDSVALAAMLLLTPPAARAADLVVWWEKGYYAQEDEALQEVIAAFEQNSGKKVELVLEPQAELPDQLEAALAGRPAARRHLRATGSTPISRGGRSRIGWSISRTRSGPSRTCSIPISSIGPDCSMPRPGSVPLYGLPMGQIMDHVHVWKSLLERAGFSLDDIPKDWDGVLVVLVRPGAAGGASGDSGRDDLWGIGLAMSAAAADTQDQFFQFVGRLRWGLRDPRGQTGHRRLRRSGRGWSRRSTAIRPSGARAARRPMPCELDRQRQQPGVSGPEGRHDAERVTLDPGRA